MGNEGESIIGGERGKSPGKGRFPSMMKKQAGGLRRKRKRTPGESEAGKVIQTKNRVIDR